MIAMNPFNHLQQQYSSSTSPQSSSLSQQQIDELLLHLTTNSSSRSTATTSCITPNDEDQIICSSPNASSFWWRNFDSAANTTTTSPNANTATNSYTPTPPPPPISFDNSSVCSSLDWDSFFNTSSTTPYSSSMVAAVDAVCGSSSPTIAHHDEPTITRIVQTSSQQDLCKITINPTSSASSLDSSMSAVDLNNNQSKLEGMISLLNSILIMNGVNPAVTDQMSTTFQPTNQTPNLEMIHATYSGDSFAPIQSFDEVQRLRGVASNQSLSNSSTLSASSSSDSDSQHSSNSTTMVATSGKISKKRSLHRKPRLKFQKQQDHSLKFNLVTSEELAATLQFHETQSPKKRNRGRPKKSESSSSSTKSPQKTTRNDQQQQTTNIEFMVNCYDQCSKIFK